MATTTVLESRARARETAPGVVLTLATTVMATATLGALLPAAVASWASGAPQAVQPVSVRLDGSLSISGLPSAPATSVLTLHNEGGSPISWTVRPRVSGIAPGAVSIAVWVSQSTACEITGVVLEPGRWSVSTLAPRDEVRLCVRITDNGTGAEGSRPRPTVSVDARTS